MTNLNTWRQGLEQAWESLADGWREVSERASSAITRFGRGAGRDNEPEEDDLPPISGRWGLLAADVYDDDERIVVRLEAPGMKRTDFEVQVQGQALIVHGRKRFDRESGRGEYRIVQCAYGRFERRLPLPVAVDAERTRASYRDGVLRIELPKAAVARRRHIAVKAA
jgi:HSP20 family protein